MWKQDRKTRDIKKREKIRLEGERMRETIKEDKERENCEIKNITQ